jgi:glycerol-3-phosphate acyltransferase PlsY
MITLASIVVISYLLGSLLMADLVGRMLGTDPRRHGSRNPGASNILRLFGWKAGVAVLLFDAAKGWVAVQLVSQLVIDEPPFAAEWLPAVAGLAVFSGHLWPAFKRLKGGKGVATAAGCFLGLCPVAILVSAVVFIVVVWITRRIAVGSLCAAASLPLILKWLYPVMGHEVPQPAFWLSLVTLALISWAHRSNISNLLAGREPRFTSGSINR